MGNMEIILLWVLFFVVYVVCGVLTFGILFAESERRWPTIAVENRNMARAFASMLALTGPLGFIVVLLVNLVDGSLCYGLKYRVKSKYPYKDPK